MPTRAIKTLSIYIHLRPRAAHTLAEDLRDCSERTLEWMTLLRTRQREGKWTWTLYID